MHTQITYSALRFSRLRVGLMSLCLLGILTSCIDEQITTSYERADVPLQFSLSLPRNGYATRQSDAIIQAANNSISGFRGIQDIAVIPFASASVSATDHPIGYSPAILSMLKPEKQAVVNAIPSGKLVGNNYSVLFENVSLPEDTRSLLFYGKAIDSEVAQSDLPSGTQLSTLASAELNNVRKHKNGSLLTVGQPLALTSTPASLYFALENISSDDVTSERSDIMVAYLNSIVTGLTNDNLLTTSEAEDFLDNKAGCSLNIKALVKDLYNTLDVGATNTRNAILAGFVDNDIDGDLISTLDNYPASLFLPDGAAAIEYVGSPTKSFRAVTNGVSFSGLEVAPPHVYTYPSALYYRANSGIYTSKVSQADKYVASNSWQDILNNYSSSPITNYTRSAAISSPIQYAVGRLDLTVESADGDILDQKNEVVEVPDLGFPVTAVLISNQRRVDYMFNADMGADAFTVYDNAIGTVYSPRHAYHTAHAETPNATRTLVLQTTSTKDIADLTLTPHHKVYVALEFVNTLNTSFTGIDGQIIPEGCHFYLVGELDPTQLSGYDANDPVRSRVFTQDYITEANFTISSLANAYNVIPDLRVSELKIGLKIDTNWQVGYHFTDQPIEFHK